MYFLFVSYSILLSLSLYLSSTIFPSFIFVANNLYKVKICILLPENHNIVIEGKNSEERFEAQVRKTEWRITQLEDYAIICNISLLLLKYKNTFPFISVYHKLLLYNILIYIYIFDSEQSREILISLFSYFSCNFSSLHFLHFLYTLLTLYDCCLHSYSYSITCVESIFSRALGVFYLSSSHSSLNELPFFYTVFLYYVTSCQL